MLFLLHQEPPPQPPAVAQIVQKSQETAALGQGPQSSLVGPPKSLMSDAKIDFKKLVEHPYVGAVAIEGQAVSVDERLAANQLELLEVSLIWGRHDRMDWKSTGMVPFWTDNVYGVGHNSRGGPLGRNTRFVPFPFPLVQQY